jgi:LmbE family N-acetylglucosaminyl deacetylase
MRMLASQGHEVISAYATAFRRDRAIEGRPEGIVRRAESEAACEILGAKPYFFPFAHEELEKPFADKKTLTAIIAWLDQTRPDIVVAHWPLDTHPNHQVVGMSTWMAYDHAGRVWGVEGLNAVKPKKGWTLYYYEVNTFAAPEDTETLAFHPNVYVDIGKVANTKRKAANCLKSQLSPSYWKVYDAMHANRGKECGISVAEAFFLVERKSGCDLLPITTLSHKP